MGCDMVVALPAATGNGQTLFGANSHRPVREVQTLRLVRGRTFAPGEYLQTRFTRLPEVRQTSTVLAAQPQGMWGYLQGINEHRLVMACSTWQSRIQQEQPGLLGPELVRLTLERSRGAVQGLEVLTDLIARHGQGRFQGCSAESADHVFLLADGVCAFAVEAAGHVWAAQELHEVRAASDVAMIRQDWYRLAPGLADRGIAEGWWPSDGSKVDFAQALAESPTGTASALRRWGRATVLMEQQNGHLDGHCLRRLLADHYEGTSFEADPLDGPAPVTPLCQHAGDPSAAGAAISGIAQLCADPQAPAIYWAALGPPCVSVYFPLLMEGDLPEAFAGDPSAIWRRTDQLREHLGHDARRWMRVREKLGRLQERFDQEAEEFLGEAAELKQRCACAELKRLASSLMQSHVERFEETVQGLLLAERGTPVRMLMVEGVGDF